MKPICSRQQTQTITAQAGHRPLTYSGASCFGIYINIPLELAGVDDSSSSSSSSSSNVNVSLKQAASNTKVAQLRQLPPELKELLAQTRVPQVLLLTSVAMKPRLRLWTFRSAIPASGTFAGLGQRLLAPLSSLFHQVTLVMLQMLGFTSLRIDTHLGQIVQPAMCERHLSWPICVEKSSLAGSTVGRHL